METNQSPFKKVTHFEFGQHYKTANNHCTTIDINLSAL